MGGEKINSVPRLEPTLDNSEKKEGRGKIALSTGATAPYIPAGVSVNPESVKFATCGLSKLAMKEKETF